MDDQERVLMIIDMVGNSVSYGDDPVFHPGWTEGVENALAEAGYIVEYFIGDNGLLSGRLARVTRVERRNE